MYPAAGPGAPARRPAPAAARTYGPSVQTLGVYAELPPAAEAAALVASVINVALAAERGRQDLSAGFRLLPVAVEETSAAGRPYLVVRWGVFVPDPDYAGVAGPHGDLVSYGALRVRRDGQPRYDPRGLHEPLTGAELDRLLAAAGDPRSAADLLAGAAPGGGPVR